MLAARASARLCIKIGVVPNDSAESSCTREYRPGIHFEDLSQCAEWIAKSVQPLKSNRYRFDIFLQSGYD